MPTPRPNGQSNSLRDKHILFVNSGGKKKRFAMEKAKQLGMKVTLLNATMDVPASLCDTFIQADTYNHKEVFDKLHRHFKANPGEKPDGAITFWEDDIPLLGKLCEEYRWPGNSYETAIMTRDKHAMRKRLFETGLGVPQFQLIVNQSDLKEAVETIGLPSVMKPVWGSDSEFVILVQNEDEVQSTYAYLQKNCNEKFNPIFKYNRGLFLYEEYMEGTEVSAECFVQYGIPHVVGINEKEPMQLPYFIECGDIVPARINSDTRQAVVKLAESALIALGVRNSLAHIEIRITPTGPKIVEVASRMGGDDIFLYVKHIWGTDLVDLGLQIACGVRAQYKHKDPTDCIVAKYFLPRQSGVVSTIKEAKPPKTGKDLFHMKITKKVGEAILVPPEGFETAGWLWVQSKSYQQAETLLNRLMTNVQINVTRFHKDSTLGKTSRENALATASIVRSEIMSASRFERLKRADIETMKELKFGIVANTAAGESIYKTLAMLGYSVTFFDMNDSPLPIRSIQNSNLDLVLNLCEADPSKPLFTSNVASLLELLQVPFSGSNSSTVATALNKIDVKKLLDYHEIPTPKWDYLEEPDDELSDELTFPLIVKPSNADNYHGIHAESVVRNEKELRIQTKKIIEEMKCPALIEEYIDGDELDVCIIGNGDEAEVLPILRSVFDNMPKDYWHIYSYDLFMPGNEEALKAIRLEKPAKISPKLNRLISEMALDIYHTFGCRDYAKIEMRVDKDGNPYVLELNPNPSIGQQDFFASAANLSGYSYEDLIETICIVAVERYHEHPSLLSR